jgi:hypothetical protein
MPRFTLRFIQLIGDAPCLGKSWPNQTLQLVAKFRFLSGLGPKARDDRK